MRRGGAPLLAGALALAYVLSGAPSRDLAAHLFRARLFGAAPFGVWDNWWYGGHHTPAYSVLVPAAGWLLTPQVAAALAATASTALLTPLLRRAAPGMAGDLAALWLALGLGAQLFTGRLAFAIGLLPAAAALRALAATPKRSSGAGATVFAALTALTSPVAALFVALGGVSVTIGSPGRRAAGAAAAAGALVPILALAAAFPGEGTEPFALATLWPAGLVAVAIALAARRSGLTSLAVACAIYALGLLIAYAIPTPVGSNAARLASLAGGPISLLVLPRNRPVSLLALPRNGPISLLALPRWGQAVLAAVALPLLWLQLEAPIADLAAAGGHAETTAAYYEPLLRFLRAHRAGGPFRVEIPFTDLHWEAYRVAPEFALARGWERQLDRSLNALLYRRRLGAVPYRTWLDALAVRFVAVADAPLDPSARPESELIASHPAFLRPAATLAHWTVYEVDGNPTLASGVARATALGPDFFDLLARRAGSTLVRVRYTPYWRLAAGSGCVRAAGSFTRVELDRAGPAEVQAQFDPLRIGVTSKRCTRNESVLRPG